VNGSAISVTLPDYRLPVAITDETYVLLTTFRKSGEGVGTAVWIVALPDGFCGFTTELGSGKVKRIRNNPQVTLQPCDMRGNVRAGTEVVHATAEVLVGDDAKPVRDAIRRKHSVMTKFFVVSDLWRRLLRRADPTECAIRMKVVP
jgi:PPOX class probable F420-dependent enzyme